MIGELFVGELSINLFLQSFSNPITIIFFLAFSFLGDPLFWIIISAILYWNNNEKESMRIATIVFINAIILGFIKNIVKRPRPDIPSLKEFTTEQAFPSGHVAIQTTIYSFYEKKIKPKQKIFFIITILFTGLARLFIGVHYFSDVVIGIIFGYFFGKIFLKFENYFEKIHLITKQYQQFFLIIMVLITIIIIFLMPKNLFLSLTLVGYYTGYLINKNNKRQKTKQTKLVYHIIGISTILITSFIATKTIYFVSGIIFLTNGLYITLFWPKIINWLEKKINKKN